MWLSESVARYQADVRVCEYICAEIVCILYPGYPLRLTQVVANIWEQIESPRRYMKIKSWQRFKQLHSQITLFAIYVLDAPHCRHILSQL